MACISEDSTGYPGYNGYIPFENGFLSEMLLEHGYNTYAIGKWHLTHADQISAAGPYDRWPLQAFRQLQIVIKRQQKEGI